MHHPRSRPIRRAVVGAGLIGLATMLAACSADPVSEAYLEGADQGFISNDFRVEEIPVEQRDESVSWAGVTEYGDELTSADTDGGVTVINFWFAACGPCRVEAADLEAVHQEYADDEVAFVGINTADQADTAVAFADQYGVTYPSLMDASTGAAKLAFARVTPISATPTTLVLDREGRVAARIIGQLESASILSTLVGDTLEENA